LVSSPFGLTPSKKGVRLCVSSLKKNSSNSNTSNIGNFNARLSSRRDKSSHTNTEEDGVFFIDLDGVGQVILTWLHDNVQTFVELGGDLISSVFVVGNKNL
jgi:hypothetical protein